MTKGPFAYDFGDTVQMTPPLPMHTLGHSFIPAPIHAGGLRYHGMAPLVSQLVMDGLIEPRAVHQLETFNVGVTWARTEGFISAPGNMPRTGDSHSGSKESQRRRQAEDYPCQLERSRPGGPRRI